MACAFCASLTPVSTARVFAAAFVGGALVGGAFAAAAGVPGRALGAAAALAG
jgi:hypothetical protein